MFKQCVLGGQHKLWKPNESNNDKVSTFNQKNNGCSQIKSTRRQSLSAVMFYKVVCVMTPSGGAYYFKRTKLHLTAL